ncbi:hypothetical protein BJ875DRAFT_471780 [Amylocarpus encephaloides]|uniref:Uncharacterized protein n=1 Tax=Amylocarpus encephaloides TaxID=45428 RepID=A0A9P8C260_9HELO|nr:hypothetical protein BJ875DRAFT_471780 [Amylocarpus encephaloides]
MSTASEGPDFATFVRMYKQWGEFRNQRLEGHPHPLAASQHPTNQVQRSIPQRLSSSRPRPQPYQQPPSRNPATFFQALDDVKKRQDEIYVAVNALHTIAKQIKKTVDEGVATMVGTMERFEVIGRGVLEMAVQPSNSQPSTGASSQPQVSNPPQLSQHASQPPMFSNPQKMYQGPNTTQPPVPFIASSIPAQPLYAPPASQAPESYSEQYLDYNGFEFLANDAS